MNIYNDKDYIYMTGEVLYQENISNNYLTEEEKQTENCEELKITHKNPLVLIIN